MAEDEKLAKELQEKPKKSEPVRHRRFPDVALIHCAASLYRSRILELKNAQNAKNFSIQLYNSNNTPKIAQRYAIIAIMSHN